jgi:transcriptional regulator with XRE-family HTH domain
MPTDLFRDALAGTVRAELARRRMTIRQLADTTGMALSTLGRRLERGDFKIDELAAIAGALDMPLAALLPAAEEAAAS